MLRVSFGFRHAIKIFYKLTFNKGISKIFLPTFNRNVYVRSGTSDIHVFVQIFCLNDYGITTNSPIYSILDGGANIGLTAVYFSKYFPTANIYCVEPDAGNLEILKLNTKDLPNVKILHGAIWNECTVLDLVDEGFNEWGFITKDKGKTNPNSVLINSYDISSLAKHFHVNSFDIIKLDIEGSEKEVFQDNYFDWMSKCKILIIELHDRLNTGCSQNFFKAASNFKCRSELKGEHIIYYNLEYENW